MIKLNNKIVENNKIFLIAAVFSVLSSRTAALTCWRLNRLKYDLLCTCGSIFIGVGADGVPLQPFLGHLSKSRSVLFGLCNVDERACAHVALLNIL